LPSVKFTSGYNTFRVGSKSNVIYLRKRGKGKRRQRSGERKEGKKEKRVF
jgi:hypothetical protein